MYILCICIYKDIKIIVECREMFETVQILSFIRYNSFIYKYILKDRLFEVEST